VKIDPKRKMPSNDAAEPQRMNPRIESDEPKLT
jgi:hypothetical protein